MSRGGPGSSVAPWPFFLRFLFLGEPRGRRGQGLWRGASRVPLWPDRHPFPSARFTHGGGGSPQPARVAGSTAAWAAVVQAWETSVWQAPGGVGDPTVPRLGSRAS